MSTHPHTRLFTQVDRTNDPDFFVRFMDEAQSPQGIQVSKRLMLERMALAQEKQSSRSAAALGPMCSTWRTSSARLAALSGSTRARL
jgi:hypothetical protein